MAEPAKDKFLIVNLGDCDIVNHLYDGSAFIQDGSL